MNRAVSASIVRARNLIAGERTETDQPMETEDLLGLVKQLQRERAFGLARRLLEKHRPDASFIRKYTHQLSLCTYKDPDLHPLEKLDRALAILKSLDNLDLDSEDCTRDQEALGQAGAIFKRKWEQTSQRAFLETSLAYYAHGYAQGVAQDYGYTGINAAFVLDLLASFEIGKSGIADKAGQAQRIREDLVAVVPGLAEQPGKEWLQQEWWFLATMAEAYFGLGRYEDAGRWLQRAAALPEVPEWEWETTSRQLARIFQLHEKNAAPDIAQKEERLAIAKQVLAGFLGERAAGLDSLLKGKIGLALSGGGFRASLFHIGLLARLAELDLLRDVEYLSCVSGGSIVGAHYYLEVRNLLQCKPDAGITRQDYIDIVERLQRDFLAGVQTNVRVGLLSEWTTNLKMIHSSEYSRTNRLGELYEEQIFSRVRLPAGCESQETSGPTQAGKLFLDELKIQPRGEAAGFSPKDQNWRRAAKIPILVLNAAPLNTGHNWQFTTTWMGESPASAGSAVDANYRLRRMYYEDAPDPHKKMRLGYAVAASSAVPGLFEPLPLAGLYPGKIVRLVDGGVHDNQATSALLEQGCNVLLVSDASGQMDAQDEPGKGVLAVPLRCDSILQARLRESQYNGLDARRHSGLLQGLLFIHLKQGLESQPVDWEGCRDPSDPVGSPPLLPYGIRREVQEKLAAIRTDLDSFSEAEAYALMTSAYRMTEHALRDPVSTLGFTVHGATPQTWKFLEIEPEMRRSGIDTPLLRQLGVSGQLFLKIWFLSKTLRVVGAALLITVLALLAYLGYRWWSVPISTTWGQIVTALFLMALGATAWKPVLQLLQIRKTAQDALVGLGMVALGAFLAKLHLHVFDRWFLRQGRLARLLGKK